VKLFDLLSRQRRFVYLVVSLTSAPAVGGAAAAVGDLPELTFSRITVVAEGSTLGARQVVFSITRPIEEAVSIVPGVTRVHSHSIRGGAEIQITFAPRTDMAYALQLVRARVNQVTVTCPPASTSRSSVSRRRSSHSLVQRRRRRPARCTTSRATKSSR